MANESVERPFRILMIAPTSFFSDYGGHIRILEETRHLQAAGHAVAIVTYYKGSDMPGLDIRRTWPLPWRADYEVGSSRHKIAFDVYLAAKSLLEGLQYRPDIIHGHMHEGALIGGVLARILRVPLVFDFQGSLTAEMVDHHFLDRNGRVYPWAHRIERFITQRLPQAILTSSYRARQLLQNDFHVAPERIHPLPDCADTARFDPAAFTPEEKAALRRHLRIPEGRPIVAYLGLLTDYQGIPHLLQAARELVSAGKNAHFLIMGYPDVVRYQALANHMGIGGWVTFTGKVEYRYAPLYLSLGDVGVAPKMSSTEGSGKLLNYMALAQPVVAYDTAVHREYLAEYGVYAPAGDVTAFAKAVDDLLCHPARMVELGRSLRQRAETTYSWQVASQKIITLYQYLTSNN